MLMNIISRTAVQSIMDMYCPMQGQIVVGIAVGLTFCHKMRRLTGHKSARAIAHAQHDSLRRQISTAKHKIMQLVG